MNNTIIILLVLALLVYLVVRQFTEQQVNWPSLLLLPAISAYADFVDLQPAFAKFSLLPLLAGLALGVLVGLATGIVRGRYTRVRLDSSRGQIYSRPQLTSSLIWLFLLLARISVIVLSYSSLQHNQLMGILTAFASALFFISISTQKFMVFMKYNRLQTSLSQHQPYSLPNR